MGKVVISLLTMVLYSASCFAGNGPLSSALKDEVFISSSTYRLADLLAPEAVQYVAGSVIETVVGKTPRPGHSTWVTASDIKARLGKDVAGLGLRSGDRVRVISSGLERSIADGVAMAQNELERWLAMRYGNYFVSPAGSDQAAIKAYEGEIGFAVRTGGQMTLSKRMRVLLDVFVDGEVFTTLPVWFSVSVIEPVWTLGEEVQADERVAMANLVRMDADVAGIRGRAFRGDLSELRFARFRPKGAILKEEDLDPMPAVTRGAPVQVIVNYGSVSLVVKGEALTDGNLDQRVSIKNLSSGESFFATVVGESRVRVR